MRIVPCRVVCYYKFNVKSWSKKMRGGGWGGWSASEMEAFIFPFCWSANVLKEKEKKKRQAEKSWSGGRGIVLYQTTRWSLFHPLVWLKQLSWAAVYCIHQWRNGRAIICGLASDFCSRSSFWEENSIYIWQSFTDTLFSVCQLWWKPVCDHGQGFPFLKCLLLLCLCQCVSEENDSWKRPLFRLALSMETGPLLGLGGQQGAFTGLLALSRSSPQPGHF